MRTVGPTFTDPLQFAVPGDPSTLLVVVDGAVHAFSAVSDRGMVEGPTPTLRATRIAPDPDGTRLEVSRASGSIQILDPATRAVAGEHAGTEASRWIATTSANGGSWRWGTVTMSATPSAATVPSSRTVGASFGTREVTGSDDGTTLFRDGEWSGQPRRCHERCSGSRVGDRRDAGLGGASWSDRGHVPACGRWSTCVRCAHARGSSRLVRSSPDRRRRDRPHDGLDVTDGPPGQGSVTYPVDCPARPRSSLRQRPPWPSGSPVLLRS